MLRPNFFIVGAPKCGTTAMHEYLKMHPEIVMSNYKEPHFFASDFVGPRFERFRNLETYLKLFESTKIARRVGESSVYYLYSMRAAREIHDFYPQSRIIAMLRSPVETMYALYHQHYFTREETLPTFREALDAEPERKQGKRVPPHLNTMLQALFYREVVRYSVQLERYWSVFGREQVHIIIYDDFRADTAKSYCETLGFLGVAADFVPDFQVVNANKQFHSERVQNFLINPPHWLMGVGKRILPVAKPIYWRLRGLNASETPRQPIGPELAQQLKRECLPEVERLSALLDRDLTHWCAI